MKTSDIGFFVSCALFIAFCALNIIGSRAETEISRLGVESIAPENLRGAAETFRLNLSVERQNRSIDDISESESWKTLEKKLSAYADRIELLREQRRFRNAVVMWGALVAGVSMAIFAIARALRKPGREQHPASRGAAERTSRTGLKPHDSLNEDHPSAKSFDTHHQTEGAK